MCALVYFSEVTSCMFVLMSFIHLQELEDIEVRLRHGGLGGVPDFDQWTTKLSSASTIQDLVSMKSSKRYILLF